MRHTIGNLQIGPFLQCGIIERAAVLVQCGLQVLVYLAALHQRILVNDLERTHAYECLLMAMVEVGGCVAVVDAPHKHVENPTRHVGILLLSRLHIRSCRIRRQSEYLPVYPVDVASGF